MTAERSEYDDAVPDARLASRVSMRMIWRGGMAIVVLVGLAIAIHALDLVDSSTVGRLIASLGWPGLLAYVLYSALVFVLMGMAWLLVMGERWRYLPAFVWARMLREAASDLFPFSQIGGIVVGADSLIARGLSGASVYAAMTADLTTEMASQALFTTLCIGLFAFGWSDRTGTPLPLLIAISLVVIATITCIARLAPKWIPAIAPRLLERSAPNALKIVNEMAGQLDRMYARRARMFGSTVLNFMAWTMSATGAWIVLHWIGSDVPWTRVLSLEAIIFALRSVAFMVPAGVGVQEAGYALAAPLFGLPIESAVIVALAKRGKDLAIGLPTLIVWQMTQTKTLVAAIKRDRLASDRLPSNIESPRPSYETAGSKRSTR